MPELPEVQTTVIGLQKNVIGLTIKDVWTDLAIKKQAIPHFKETLKSEVFYKKFGKIIRGKKITSVERRAKNILIHLQNNYTILIHMKMTGHLLYGKYTYNSKKKTWSPALDEKNEALRDPFNRFIHVVLSFTNGKHLVLSDMRKFAKTTLLETKNIEKDIHLEKIGPEPLEKKFTLKKFTERLLKKPNNPVKKALLDQTLIAGIGNIYSDEMLWLSHIHPQRKIAHIKPKEFSLLFSSMKKVLLKGINFQGDSTSDYRNIDGTPGKFNHHHNAYRLTDKQCQKKGCKGIIKRIVVAGRSAHFCNTHQI